MRMDWSLLSRVAAIAILCGAIFVGCSRSPKPPNIVLISIDSLRPDRLGIYGHDQATSINIDRLAAESVIFDNAFSTTSWTLPSHVSMLTGLYPEVHGVFKGRHRLSDKGLLCSEVLQELGYQTRAVVSGPFLRRKYGFDQGWDDYDDYTIKIRGKSAHRISAVTSQQHSRVVEMLDEMDQRPFFLFLYYWDVHYDYNPPEPWDTQFDPDYEGEITSLKFANNDQINRRMDPRDLEHILALYDGEIAFTDHYLGRLFEELRERGLYEDTVIVITADHGDEFFEHGAKGHRSNLYNSTLKIPLLIKFPRGEWGGERVEAPVSIVDIAPTLLDYLESDRFSSVHGKSLLPAIRGTREGTRTVFADLSGRDKAMVSGNWKLVTSSRTDETVELYNLQTDSDEQENLFGNHREKGEEMFEELQRWLSVANRQAGEFGAESIEYDDETREVLESLGYLD